MLVLAALGLGLALAGPGPADRRPVAAAVGGLAVVTPLPPAPDPFPIRRVFLPAERVAETALRDRLVKLPRAEFESKVRATGRTPPAPRLTSAAYTAALTAGGLTGTAELRLTGPGLAPLAPFGPAVRSARWADGSAAVLVAADGGPAVWVPGGGDSVLSLEWSARGAEEPAADRFDLTLPPAAVATLALDLPADHTPTVDAPDLLLTGPFPAAADRRRWVIALGGVARVPLRIGRPGGTGQPAPLVRADRSARYTVTSGAASAAFDFDLTPVRGQPAEWVLEHDSALTVTGVSGAGRLSWRSEPGNRVRVTADAPEAVRRLTVTALTAVPADGGEWACPTVRLVGAVPGADRIEVRFDPDLLPGGCDPGGYRVTDARADGGYRITFAGTLSDATRAPPRLTLCPSGPRFSTTDDIAWALAGDRSAVAARFKLTVARGPLLRIPVTIPAGYAVESVRLIPDDPGATTAADPAAGLVTVEPSKPVAGGQTVEVVATFRGPPVLPPADPGRVPAPPRTVPFPQAAVPGATDRTGRLSITAGPGFRVWADPPTGSLTYPVRGRPVSGTLAVAPRPPRATVDHDTTVSLTPTGLTATTALAIRCLAGEIGGITLFTPTVPGGAWQVTAAGARVERVPGGELAGWAGLLAAGSGWAAVGGAAAGTDGSLWQVRSAEVGTERTVTAIVTVPVPADPGPVSVPVPTVLGAAADPNDVTLDPAAAGRFEPAGAVGFPAAVRLAPRGAAPAVRPRGWAFADLDLVARVGPDGGRTCTLTGRVTGAGGSWLPVRLPAGATALGATVDGRRADPLGDDEVRLPVPTPGAEGTGFELRYRLPPADWAGATTLDSRPPELSGEPPVRTRWVIARELRAWPALGPLDEPAEQPGDTITVVRTDAVRAAGWAVAAGVFGLGVGLIVRRAGPRRVLVFAAVVGLLGVAGWVVPAGWRTAVRPPAAAGLLALAGWVAARRRDHTPTSAEPDRSRLASTASYGPAVVAIGLLATAGTAQAPAVATVYVVSEPAGLSVLAPQPVLDRLAALARSPLPPVAVVAAEYEGTAAGSLVAVTARFTLHATTDAQFTLPLTGVRLESLDLDGKLAYPSATTDGYAVAVTGAGRHELVARFAVPLAGTGADREVRFTGPDVPVGRVRFETPEAAGLPDVVSRRGVQALSADGRHRADADHGGGGAIRVRWRDGPTGTARVEVKEACVWDVTPDGMTAVAAAVFTVAGGTVGELAFDLPADLEPGPVAVRWADGRPGPGLRGWRLDPTADGGRRMTVQLETPADGRLTAAFRLFPNTAGTARPALRFPRAVAPAGERYAAIRTTGVTVEGLQPEGVIDYPADVLTREFADFPELELDRPPDRVFQRTGAGPAGLRPTLRVVGPPPPTAEVTWTVGRRATAEGIFRQDRSASGLVMFDLPSAVAVTDVRGAGVVAWARVGTRVQVWTTGPRPGGVRWAGELAGPTPAAGTVALPVPVTGGPVTARVKAAGGWVVTPQPEPTDGETVELPAGADAVRVAVFAPQPPTGVRVREAVDGPTYRATVTLDLAAGRPHRFTLRVAGLPDGRAEVTGPAGVVIGEPVVGPDDTGWPVGVPATVPGPVSLSLTVRLPSVNRLPEPLVLADGLPVPAVERVLTTVGSLAPTAGPPGWWAADRSGTWAGHGMGRWVVAARPAEPPHTPGTVPPPSTQPTRTDAEDSDRADGSWLAAVGWLAGLGVVLTAAVARPGRGRPELVLAVGLLGAVAAGSGSVSETVFLGVAGLGVAGRIGWGLRRLARVVLR